MVIDLAAMLVAALIVLAILIGQNVVSGTSALLLAAVIVTNGVYEFVLMFFLAYGIVEFPRYLWNKSDLEYSLLSTQMKATNDYQEISDHKINIQEDISKVKYFKDQVGKLSSDEGLRIAVQVLEADCPDDFKSDRKCKAEEVKEYLSKNGQVTLAGLAKLRQSLNANKDKYKMAQAKVRTTERTAYILEDLVSAQRNKSGVIFWSLRNKESSRAEYQWHVVIKPRLYRAAAIGAALLSIFSFLGVICSMAGVPNEASVYFLATHSSSATGPDIVVFILFTLGYTTYVTLWSIFQIRVSGFVELVPFRTSPEFLSFNTRMCLRLAAPIAFFYLGWIAENGLKSGSWTQWVQTTTTTFANTTAPALVPTLSPLMNLTTVSPSHIPSLVPSATPSFSFSPTLPNTTLFPVVSTPTVLSGTSSTTFEMLSSFSQFYNIQAVAFVTSLYGTGFPVILFILVPLFLFNIFNRVFVLLRMPYMQFGTPIATDEQLREGKRQLAKFKRIAERAEQRGILRGYLANFGKYTPDESGNDPEAGAGAAGATSASGGGGGLLSRFFGKSNTSDADALNAPPVSTLVEPEPLRGDLERKVNVSRLTGSTWKSMYAEVAKPGILYFFKDQAAAQAAFQRARSADPSDAQSVLEREATDVYDLKEIKNFSSPSKKNDQNNQLDLELNKEVVRLRYVDSSLPTYIFKNHSLKLNFHLCLT